MDGRLCEVLCFYLSCSERVSWSIGSQMWGNWYLPMFLFSEGSLTLINMTSLIFLVTPCDSLWIMLKQSGLIGWPVVLLCWSIGEGALRCSFILSPSVLPDSPMYCSGQFVCMLPLFCSLWSLSLWAMRSVLTVLVPLKCTCMPLSLQFLGNCSPKPCM